MPSNPAHPQLLGIPQSPLIQCLFCAGPAPAALGTKGSPRVVLTPVFCGGCYVVILQMRLRLLLLGKCAAGLEWYRGV